MAVNNPHSARAMRGWRPFGLLLAFFVYVATAEIGLAKPAAQFNIPDLAVTKTNSGGGAGAVGAPFTWSLTIANAGSGSAILVGGKTLIQDDLPTNATYGAVTIADVVGVTGLENVSCAVAGNTLSCPVTGGIVEIGSGGGLTVNVATTATSGSSLVNPRAGGACTVDVDNIVPESDESNNSCSDSVVLGVTDLSVDKVNSTNGVATLGIPFVWTLAVRNGGGDEAAFGDGQVLLRDALPDGADYGAPQLVNAAGVTGIDSVDCSLLGSALACTAGAPVTIAVGGGFTLTLPVTPTLAAPLINPSSGVCRVDPDGHVAEVFEDNNDCADSVSVNAVDLLIQKSDSVGGSAPGEIITYTLSYANAGNQMATGIVISETVPPFTTFAMNASSGDWDCADGSAAGSTCRMAIPMLAASSATSTTIFAVRISDLLPSAVDQIVNSVSIFDDGANGLDKNVANNVAMASTPVQRAPRLEAVQRDLLHDDADGDQAFSPGDTIRYTIVVSNTGNGPASAVTVTSVPDPLTEPVIGSVTTIQGSVTSGNQAGDTSIGVEIGMLATSATVTLTYDVRIVNPLPLGATTVTAQSGVDSSDQSTILSDDPDTIAEGDATTTELLAAPSLVALKTDLLLVDADGNETASPGDTIRYDVTIENLGNQAASGVVFSDIPDGNTTLNSGSVLVADGRGAVVQGNGDGESVVQVNIGDMEGGGDRVSLSFAVTIVDPLAEDVEAVNNQGTVSSIELPQLFSDDPDLPGNADVTRTAVSTGADLYATLRDYLYADIDRNRVVSVGDRLLFRLDLFNIGKAAATGLRVTVSVPQHTSMVGGTLQTDTGTILSGLDDESDTVSVDIGMFGASQHATLSYLVEVSALSSRAYLQSQGTVRFDDARDGVATITTDDPDTPSSLPDATRTPLLGDLPLEVVYLPAVQTQ